MKITKEAIEAGVAAFESTFNGSPNSTEMVTTILTAALAAMPGPAVKVKPLEWVDRAAADGNSRNSYADTSVGSYEAFELNMNVPSGPVTVFGWSGIPWKKDQHVESFEAAKAAAQADYEARILSAITPANDLASENESLPQDVVNLVIAAREFWDVAMDESDESAALDCALEAFSIRVPYENDPEEDRAALERT